MNKPKLKAPWAVGQQKFEASDKSMVSLGVYNSEGKQILRPTLDGFIIKGPDAQAALTMAAAAPSLLNSLQRVLAASIIDKTKMDADELQDIKNLIDVLDFEK